MSGHIGEQQRATGLQLALLQLCDGLSIGLQALSDELALEPQAGIVSPGWNITNQVSERRLLPVPRRKPGSVLRALARRQCQKTAL